MASSSSEGPARRGAARWVEPGADVHDVRDPGRDGVPQCILVGGADAVDRARLETEAAGDGGEVRSLQLGAEIVGGVVAIAQHPVAAVVDDDRGERELL